MAHMRRWLVFAAGAMVPCAVFAACTSNIHPPIADVGGTNGSAGSPGVDAGVDADASEDGGASACFGFDGGCNNLGLCTPKIFITNVAQTAPVAAGGAIVPGVYAMTSYLVYTGAGGATGQPGGWFKETFQDGATSTDDGGAEDGGSASGSKIIYPWLDVTLSNTGTLGSNYNGTIDTQGVSLQYVFDCPGGSPFSATFTTTPTTITIFFPDPGGTAALGYTLLLPTPGSE